MNNPKSGQGRDFPDTEPLSMVPHAEEYAATEPMPLAELHPAAAAPGGLSLELAPVGAGEYELMAEIRKEGRICPLPTRWLEFYRVLQDAAHGAALPAPPMSGSAWAANTPATKRNCFAAQVAWAVEQGCVPQAYEFLSALPKSDWYYGG
ncbi:MAG: hypothetical protein KGL68_15580 [Burkholderiales bacterium]|nr:hypothetical protein [Burkholderiales bacterium]